MNTVRTFIAIELDDSTRQALSTIQAQLKKTGADVKWVKPENSHLTLKFLGEPPVDKIKPITESVNNSCRKNPFLLEWSHLGAFPTIEHPQVIWIGIEKGKDQIREIAFELEGALEKLGFKKERREFDPHITLGRCRSPLNRFALFKAIKDYNLPIISQEVRKIVFIKSTLSAQGPHYEAIKEFPLVS